MLPVTKDLVIPDGCTCARHHASSQRAGSGGTRRRGPMAPQKPAGGHPHCCLHLIGQGLVPGRREAGSAVCQLGEDGGWGGWTFPVRWPSLPNGLGAQMGNPGTGQCSRALPGARRPETAWAAMCASRHLQGRTRAASASTCPRPHPLRTPVPPCSPPQGRPAVVLKTLACRTCGSAGDARSCVRGHQRRE